MGHLPSRRKTRFLMSHPFPSEDKIIDGPSPPIGGQDTYELNTLRAIRKYLLHNIYLFNDGNVALGPAKIGRPFTRHNI